MFTDTVAVMAIWNFGDIIWLDLIQQVWLGCMFGVAWVAGASAMGLFAYLNGWRPRRPSSSSKWGGDKTFRAGP